MKILCGKNPTKENEKSEVSSLRRRHSFQRQQRKSSSIQKNKKSLLKPVTSNLPRKKRKNKFFRQSGAVVRVGRPCGRSLNRSPTRSLFILDLATGLGSTFSAVDGVPSTQTFGAPALVFLLILALNYFPRGPPHKYRRSLYVSHLSSRWVRVVPYKRKHQKKDVRVHGPASASQLHCTASHGARDSVAERRFVRTSFGDRMTATPGVADDLCIGQTLSAD